MAFSDDQKVQNEAWLALSSHEARRQRFHDQAKVAVLIAQQQVEEEGRKAAEVVGEFHRCLTAFGRLETRIAKSMEDKLRDVDDKLESNLCKLLAGRKTQACSVGLDLSGKVRLCLLNTYL